MLELASEESRYELSHPSGATFVMSHWMLWMQDEVDKQCIEPDGKGGFAYSVSEERRLKILHAVKDWRGVSQNGQEVPCTPENKRKLPVGVVLWLVQEIDGRAGLRMSTQEKKT